MWVGCLLLRVHREATGLVLSTVHGVIILSVAQNHIEMKFVLVWSVLSIGELLVLYHHINYC